MNNIQKDKNRITVRTGLVPRVFRSSGRIRPCSMLWLAVLWRVDNSQPSVSLRSSGREREKVWASVGRLHSRIGWTLEDNYLITLYMFLINLVMAMPLFYNYFMNYCLDLYEVLLLVLAKVKGYRRSTSSIENLLQQCIIFSINHIHSMISYMTSCWVLKYCHWSSFRLIHWRFPAVPIRKSNWRCNPELWLLGEFQEKWLITDPLISNYSLVEDLQCAQRCVHTMLFSCDL